MYEQQFFNIIFQQQVNAAEQAGFLNPAHKASTMLDDIIEFLNVEGRHPAFNTTQLELLRLKFKRKFGITIKAIGFDSNADQFTFTL